MPIADITSYDDEFDRIVRAIFGKSSQPPLGPPPSFANVRPPAGLTPADAVVFEELASAALERGVPSRFKRIPLSTRLPRKC